MDDVEKNSSTPYKKEKVYVQVGMSDDNYTQIEGKGIEQGIRVLIETYKELGLSRNETILKVADKFTISQEDSEKYVEMYW